MSNITIRQANIADSERLTELAYKTYWDTFHSHPKNDPKDFAAYMKVAFSHEQIHSELSDKNAIFILAEIENKTIGYAKLELFKTIRPIRAKKPIEINRIYSIQEFIGKGIGQKLMDECITMAQKLCCDIIWLGVWEHNPRAIRFYERNGFREVGSHLFQMGSDQQTDLIMSKSL